MRALGLIVLGFAACGGASGGKPDAGEVKPDAAPAVDAVPADAATCPAVTTFAPASAHEVTVGGDAPAMGIFDPSVVYPAGASAGAMAYSAVPDQMTIRTHVAVSADGGGTWTYVAEANAPEATSIASTDANECPGGACSGNLISEVSSIVIDPTEPDANKRWKLFAHRYLVGAGVALHYRIGTITLQTAASPQGPWTAPQKLIGWNSPAPYSSTGVASNVSTLAGTAQDCVALTEPAALVLPVSIELAVGCVYLDAGTPKIRIELLRSTDHAQTFASVGTLLGAADSGCMTPGASLNGADLFVVGSTEYVSATPSDSNGYHGCLVFPVDDIAAGTVRRDGAGNAMPSRALAPTPAQFSGACTFSEGGGGYSLDVGYLGDARPFRIFAPALTTP